VACCKTASPGGVGTFDGVRAAAGLGIVFFFFQTLKSSSVVLEKGKIKNSSGIFVGSWPRYLLLQQQRLSTLCQAQLARSRDIFCHTMTSREHTGLEPVVYNIKLLCTDRRCVCRPVFDMLQHLPGIHDTSHLLFLANLNILFFFLQVFFFAANCKRNILAAGVQIDHVSIGGVGRWWAGTQLHEGLRLRAELISYGAATMQELESLIGALIAVCPAARSSVCPVHGCCLHLQLDFKSTFKSGAGYQAAPAAPEAPDAGRVLGYLLSFSNH
jgi:hypothetical protein